MELVLDASKVKMKVGDIVSYKLNGWQDVETDCDIKITAVLFDCDMFEGVIVKDRLPSNREGQFYTDYIESIEEDIYF